MKNTACRQHPVRDFALALLVFLVSASPDAIWAQTLQHRYSFSTNATDSVGGANGTLVGNAYITNGALYLPGGGNSDTPAGYVSLPNGILQSDGSITVEAWVTDNGGLVWAETWCFGDSAAGAGQNPNYGTSYISLIPHSGQNDFRAAFNLDPGNQEIDVIDSSGPMPLNVEQYAVVTYDAASTTARLYLNGAQVAVASIPTNLAPANYGNTFDNWLGRDEFGPDPMFAGVLDELRIWNGAVSPLYIALSSAAGPNVLVTNTTPVSVSIVVTDTNMMGGQVQPAIVRANFSQITNAVVTGAATNWLSSNTNVLIGNGNGLITAVSAGTATVSATVGGVTATSAAIMVTTIPPILAHRYSFISDASDSAGGANGTLVAPNGGAAASISHGLYLPGNPGGGNGVSGYVALPDGIVSGDASVSVECWVQPNSVNTWAEIWDFGSSSSVNFALIQDSPGPGNMRVAFTPNGGEQDIMAPTWLPSGTEAYVAVTYNNATLTGDLYLNGAPYASTVLPNSSYSPGGYGGSSGTTDNSFGNDVYGDPQFGGVIYEVRVWNGVLSPLNIAVSAAVGPETVVTNPTPLAVNVIVTNTSLSASQTETASVIANFQQVSNVTLTGAAANWTSSNTNVLIVNPSGLITAVGIGTATISATVGSVTGTSAVITVAPFNAGAATVAYWQFNNSSDLGLDSSAFGNTLAASSGTPTYSNAGKFGGALYLDGNSTMTTLSGAFPAGVPTNANPYTIAVWEKVDTSCPNNGGFAGWGANNTSQANDLRLNGPNSLDDYWFNNDFVVTGLSTNPMDGNWHAVIVTWDGTTQTMYLDGVNVGTRIPTLPNVQGTGFVVGKTTADVAFKGWLENLLIANVALGPAQISDYQQGNWLLTPYPQIPAASPSNTVYAGTTVTLSSVVAGTPPYQYQWQENGTNIPGATTATLVLTNAQLANAGNYSVVVANPAGTNISPALVLTVRPPSPPIFLMQPAPASSTNYVGGLLTLTAAVDGTGPIQLQWQHNGINLPNATAPSITLATLQLSEAGNYTLVASNALGVTNSLPAVVTVLTVPNSAALNVLTYHNDNTRQGANTNEYILTTANVNVSTFGKLITYPTDGNIIAQPLYVSGLAIPGQGTHNVVFAATENNSIYACDADSDSGTNGGVLWQVNLGTAAYSFSDQFGNRFTGTSYPDIVPVVGITGTPVIDPSSGTLYVDVHTGIAGANTTNYYHHIHALNITDGAERSFSPVEVTNVVAGTGVDSSHGVVAFNALQENQRPGLTLAGGRVYVAYGSYADTDPYHGWVIGFNATNLASAANLAFCTTPNASTAAFGVNAGEGALWMGGNGLCVDAGNNLYFATGNGSFSANTNGGDYADSFVKLSTTNGLAVADYFSPYNQATLAANDTDLGSGGTILLPDTVGSAAHPHLIIGCGKEGTLRLVDRDNMGHFNASNDSQIVQEVSGATSTVLSTPAYFNNQIYLQAIGAVMKAFLITNGTIVAAPVSQAATTFNAPGGTPSISANGTNNGIVWTIQPDGSPAVLRAYNATNLALELYNSSQNPGRDNPGPALKMTTPTVVNGKVFVGTQNGLSIYGNSLFLATPVIAPAGGAFTNFVTVTLSDATPNSAIYYSLDGTTPTTNSLPYTGPFVVRGSATVQAIAAQPGTANSAAAAAQYTILQQIPFLFPGAFTNGVFQFSLEGPTGSLYVLQVSTNLTQWTSISTSQPASTPFSLSDPKATNFPERFYRVLMKP